jgi:hypothetical protein
MMDAVFTQSATDRVLLIGCNADMRISESAQRWQLESQS